jgi:hypothetical protein
MTGYHLFPLIFAFVMRWNARSVFPLLRLGNVAERKNSCYADRELSGVRQKIAAGCRCAATLHAMSASMHASQWRPAASFARFPVMQIGHRVDETGLLLRDGGSFYLRRDAGGRFALDLRRTPVDQVEKRVRLDGTYVGPDLVDVEGVSLI